MDGPSVGDEVAEGDVVCEVMTDKVDMEVETTVSGTLVEIVVESGMADGRRAHRLGRGRGHRRWLRRPAAAQPEPEPDAVAEPEPCRSPQQPRRAAAVEPRRPEPEPASAGPVRRGPPGARPGPRARRRPGAVTGTGPDGLVRVEDVEAAWPPARGPPPPPAQAPAACAGAAPSRTGRRAGAPGKAPRPQGPRGRGRAHDDDERRDPAVHRVARDRARRARTTPRRASRGPPCCSGRTPPRCATCPSCCAAGRTGRRGRRRSARGRAGRGHRPGAAGADLPRARPRRDPHGARRRDPRRSSARPTPGKLDPPYLGVANGSLSNLGGQGVDRFQALLTPPQASVLTLGAIRAAAGGGPGRRRAGADGPGRPHRRPPGRPTAPTPPTLLARLRRPAERRR